MEPIRRRRKAIAVCGAGVSDAMLNEAAWELGRVIVEKGLLLVCGGMFGIMEAACQGGQEARQHGGEGLVVGILPASEADAGNVYCDIVIPTGIGFARNSIVVLSADAVILVGGGAGTLSEAAYAWQYSKPLIALSTTGGWAKKLSGTAIDTRRPGAVIETHTPAEAVAAALACMG